MSIRFDFKKEIGSLQEQISKDSTLNNTLVGICNFQIQNARKAGLNTLADSSTRRVTKLKFQFEPPSELSLQSDREKFIIYQKAADKLTKNNKYLDLLDKRIVKKLQDSLQQSDLKSDSESDDKINKLAKKTISERQGGAYSKHHQPKEKTLFPKPENPEIPALIADFTEVDLSEREASTTDDESARKAGSAIAGSLREPSKKTAKVPDGLELYDSELSEPESDGEAEKAAQSQPAPSKAESS